jgi:hypothetical protein
MGSTIFDPILGRQRLNSPEIGTGANQAAPGTHVSDPAAHPYTVKTSAFTAVAGGRYQTEGTFGVADPLDPVVNQQYEVLIGSGAATIGGVAHLPSRLPVVRRYNGAAWTTLPAVVTGELTVDGTPFSSDFSNVFTAHPTAAIKIPASVVISRPRLTTDETFPMKILSAVSSPSPALTTWDIFYAEPSTNTLNNLVIFKTDLATNFYLWGDASYLYVSQVLGDTTNCFRAALNGQFTAGVMTGLGTYTGTITMAAVTANGSGALGATWVNGIYNGFVRNHMSFAGGNALAIQGSEYLQIPAGTAGIRMSAVGGSGTCATTGLYGWWHIHNFTRNTAHSQHVSGLLRASVIMDISLASISAQPGDFIHVVRTANNRYRNAAAGYLTCIADVLTFY